MISRIALALSIVLLAAGCLMPGAPEKEPLVAVSNFLHPPFSSKDADGRPVGVEVEFVEEAARRLGRRVEWREMAFGELIDAVFWGKADIAGATIGITDGRMKRVAFSNPYYRTNIVALTRPGAGEPRTLEALRGRRVATDKGTTAVAATAKRIPEAIRVTERLPGKTWAELLLAGEVDAIVLDQSHVEKFSADAGAELVEIAEPLREEVFGLVVGKSARELREALNEVIAEEATQLDTKPTAPGEFETVGTLVGVSASSAQYQPGYFSDDHKQALSITGKRTLVLKDRKRRNPVAPWNETFYAFNAAFNVTRLVSGQFAPDKFYLLGTSDSGDDVIQHWKKKPVSLPGGGGYVMKRVELYRGTNLGEIHTMGVDLFGDYLVLIHDNPAKMSQLLLPSAVQQIVFDSAQLPALDFLRGAESVYPRQHTTEGRIWIASMYRNADLTIPGLPRGLFYDLNNDGVFDSWAGPIYQSDWEALGYDQDVWE